MLKIKEDSSVVKVALDFIINLIVIDCLIIQIMVFIIEISLNFVYYLINIG